MEITVKRSRRKTLSLTVTREGEAVVRAPLATPDEEIQAFVMRHRRWLNARLAASACPVPSLADGAELVLFGVRYTVAAGKGGIRDERILLPAEGRAEALCSVLKKLALREMGELTGRIAEKYGFRYSGVRISSARTRWGSCNKKGGISYTFRTAFLPYPVAEYIAVHELCHTRCFDHSPAFWREVGAVLPDYSARRRELRRYEWAMKFL